MSRVRDFFLEEAEQSLAVLRDEGLVEAGAAAPLHAAARRLRGNAQVARYGGVAALAYPIERRLKRLERGEEPWAHETRRILDEEVAALADAVQSVREGRVERESMRERAMEDPRENPDAGQEPEVSVHDLEYRGVAALRRATDLRKPLEEALAESRDVAPILDELFDLIGLGME
jgi:chemotaxis protein histidine kinase CheA